MAATKRKPQPKKNSRAAAPACKKRTPWLWIGTAAVVLILAVVAIVASSGSDDESADVKQSWPVSISGTALPKLTPEAGDTDPAAGQVIPEATGKAFDGSRVAIRNDGRAKLILFVAHWCPHCQTEITRLADWLKTNSLPNGVDFYTVSSRSDSRLPNYPPADWLKTEGWKVPTLADDGKAADAFGPTGFPHFIAIDGSGKVVSRVNGEISTDDFQNLARKALGSQ